MCAELGLSLCVRFVVRLRGLRGVEVGSWRCKLGAYRVSGQDVQVGESKIGVEWEDVWAIPSCVDRDSD